MPKTTVPRASSSAGLTTEARIARLEGRVKDLERQVLGTDLLIAEARATSERLGVTVAELVRWVEPGPGAA